MARAKWVSPVLILVALAAILGFLYVISTSDSSPTVPSVGPTGTETSATPRPTPTTAPAAPTDVPTPVPPKELAICQAAEPDTLFVYGNLSRAARNVLEAIYDGPIDTPAYQFQPTILARLPSLEDGDAVLRTVRVEEGDRVLDVNNEWVVQLSPGVAVLDAAGQQVVFEEGGVVTMTQMVVTFTLRSDVTWADGHPLTADDSRYAFELAGELLDSLPPHAQLLYDRTLRYEVAEEHTVVWTSVPGYGDTFRFYGLPLQNAYVQNFYAPLPRHVWGDVSADSLLSTEVAHRKPLGWGPFTIEEWVPGRYISLVRNPHYFRAAEDLPYLDRVIFRFVSDTRQAIEALEAGECDIITPDVIEMGDLAPLIEAAESGSVQVLSSPSSEWEHLDYGIQPSRWAQRPDYFGDVRVRQAIAQCIDRERIVAELPFSDGAAVAHSFVAAEHPLYDGDRLARWAYDPPAGRALLEEAGWQDEDGDGIREARGVTGVSYGTPFTVTLLTTQDDPARTQTAGILSENLAACGIGLAVEFLPAWEFIADGPDGPVLGRQFELALHSWNNGLHVPCELYLSSQIPGPENWWATPNNPGYASDVYDEACQGALDALTGTDAHVYHQHEAQRVFAEDLPVLPLYFVPSLVAVRPGVSGVAPAAAEYVTWNIEVFDVTTGR